MYPAWIITKPSFYPSLWKNSFHENMMSSTFDHGAKKTGDSWSRCIRLAESSFGFLP